MQRCNLSRPPRKFTHSVHFWQSSCVIFLTNPMTVLVCDAFKSYVKVALWNETHVFINSFFIHSNLTFSIHSVDIQCQIHLLPIQVHFYSIHLWNILKGDSGKKFQMLYWTARAEIVKFLWPIFSCFWHFCISWYFHFCHQIFLVSCSSIYSYSYSQKYQDVGKLG